MVTPNADRQRSIRRWIEIPLLSLISLGLILCAADWLTWKLRGSPLGSVVVTRLVVAPLKGGREEYYQDGTEAVACTQSSLPWSGNDACWWVRRRRVVVER